MYKSLGCDLIGEKLWKNQEKIEGYAFRTSKADFWKVG